MSRGCSYGGGQSSLGYLFGADEQPSAPTETPPIQPPYGTEITPENPPLQYKPSSEKQTEKNIINNYHRAKGQNSGNFITDRPSTKVKSVPGGDSSLGYLFGDN
ncbi:Protein SPIRAL1-like 2 [Hibiscus syriacus]|uniref:Protein SPIRAL1-like 2 n=1 Tax=Hibiscus syriacus TaxID=106335 RepID=A0A6A2WNJ7_HIBSY|nr:protein SPIRAL1-like 5 isoform X2 [Hibiscus syriacus]KAE8657305.1 Protein SPIRAL1-like 2 [Hibiscus syriacus]